VHGECTRRSQRPSRRSGRTTASRGRARSPWDVQQLLFPPADRLGVGQRDRPQAAPGRTDVDLGCRADATTGACVRSVA
jgi:hypothetical protein